VNSRRTASTANAKTLAPGKDPRGNAIAFTGTHSALHSNTVPKPRPRGDGGTLYYNESSNLLALLQCHSPYY